MKKCERKEAARGRSRLSVKQKREISRLAGRGLCAEEISKRTGIERSLVAAHLRELEEGILSRFASALGRKSEEEKDFLERLVELVVRAEEQRRKALRRRKRTKKVLQHGEEKEAIEETLEPDFVSANRALEIELKCLKEAISFLKERRGEIDGEQRFGVEQLSDEELEERLRILEGSLCSRVEAGEADTERADDIFILPESGDKGRKKRSKDKSGADSSAVD